MISILALSSLIGFSLVLVFVLRRKRPHDCASRARKRTEKPPQVGGRVAPKPLWVHEEVIQLKALMAGHGYRKIAIVFNSIHGDRRKMTVGTSSVAGMVRGSREEIRQKRRQLKHRVPQRIPKNTIWALDLTTIVRFSASSTTAPAPALACLQCRTRP